MRVAVGVVYLLVGYQCLCHSRMDTWTMVHPIRGPLHDSYREAILVACEAESADVERIR